MHLSVTAGTGLTLLACCVSLITEPVRLFFTSLKAGVWPLLKMGLWQEGPELSGATETSQMLSR